MGRSVTFRDASLRRAVGGVTVAVVVAALGLAMPAGAAPGTSSGTDSAGVRRVALRPTVPKTQVVSRHKVTLITGDVVMVSKLSDGSQSAAIDRAPGRERVSFSTRRVNGNSFVIPLDAQPLISGGKLDQDLFNVTALVDSGYDDASQKSIPLLVSYPRTRVVSRVAPAALPGAVSGHTLASINARSMAVQKAKASTFWSALRGTGSGIALTSTARGLEKVWLDRKVRAAMTDSVPKIGAPQAWAAGYTGAGVTVAILDTGIDTTHPDLDGGKVVAAASFIGGPDTRDLHGHGTHVASIVAGDGQALGSNRKGVAPGSKLLNAKVLGSDGGGFYSGIIAGLEWAAAQGARIASLSLSQPLAAPADDPLIQAVDRISRDSDLLMVVAAGDIGIYGIASPGWADEALTVGAVNKHDALAIFSSRGPRSVDHGIKPDITAPGIGIVAARAAGTSLGTVIDSRYTQADGTSMAAAHVAGAAALIAQRFPGDTHRQLKDRLVSTSLTIGGQTVYEQGGGRVAVPTGSGYASPGTLSLGSFRYPHTGQASVTKRITYANHGLAAVTYALSLSMTGSNGSPAPAGVFRANKTNVTVPAGGTSTVDVTVDPATGAMDTYGGYLVASGGGTVLHTSIGAYIEPEMYDLTVRAIARDGRPATYHSSVDLFGLVDGQTRVADFTTSPTHTFRVPPGAYSLMGFLPTLDAEDFYILDVTLVGNPDLRVTGDATVVLDARAGVQASVTTPKPTTTSSGALAYYRAHGDHTFQRSWEFIGPDSRLFAVPTAAVTLGTFEFHTRWERNSPAHEVRPYLYELLFPEKQRIPATMSYTANAGNLARVDAVYTADIAGQIGAESRHASRNGMDFSTSFLRRVARPTQREEWVSANDTTWLHTAYAGDSFNDAYHGPATRYQPGTSTSERWFGRPSRPSATANWPLPGVLRISDYFELYLPPHSDSAGRVSWGATEDQYSTNFYANGQLIHSGSRPLTHYFLPALSTPATYRLHFDTNRQVPWSAYAIETNTAWTFKSIPPPDWTHERPPLLQVDYRLGLDLYNRAPAGVNYSFGLTVGQIPHADGPRVSTVEAWVSYNDGGTWQRISLRGGSKTDMDAQRIATVRHPVGADAVSLRVRATDVEGNSIEQTIIRAHGLYRAFSTQTPRPMR